MEALVAPAPAFRYEADLVDVVEARLSAAVFSPAVRNHVQTFTEVPARLGVPDVSAIRYDWDAIDRRAAEAVRPLTSEPSVRAALLLRRRNLDLGELADALRMSKDHVRRAVVADLRERGWLAETPAAGLRLKAGARHAGRRVVTVEAKLRDWQNALGQARRQRYSADHAYIALDARTAGRLGEHLPGIARQGVGLIAVDPETSTVKILQRPADKTRTRSNLVGRTLMAERGLDLLARGQRAGEVYPVFGWTLPRP